MNSNYKEKQLEAAKGWWDSEKIDKWDRKYDDYELFTMRYLNSRQTKILKFIDELKFKKGAKVLELGYGAGQTALKLGQRGFEVYGVDISQKLSDLAKQRCLKNCPEGNFFLKIGNLDSKLNYGSEKFDLVVIVGVLQYLYDPNVCLKEAYRVLKPGGYLINAQLNTFRLNRFTSIRKFLVTCTHFILNEKHVLHPSFRAIIVDSKLGTLFKRFEKSKFLNSKFMIKGHLFWKYEVKKNIFSGRILKSILKKIGFTPLKVDGVFYSFYENSKYHKLNIKIDKFLQKLIDKGFAPFLLHRGQTTIVLSQK